MSLKTFIDIINKNNYLLTQSDLLALKRSISDLHKSLDLIFDDDKVKDLSRVDSDFNYEHIYNSEKIENPSKFFSFCFGVVRIEIVKGSNFFSVRSYNWVLPRSVNLSNFYSVSSKSCFDASLTPFDSSSKFSSGWYYYGLIKDKTDFSKIVDLYNFIVQCFFRCSSDYGSDVDSYSVSDYW